MVASKTQQNPRNHDENSQSDRQHRSFNQWQQMQFSSSSSPPSIFSSSLASGGGDRPQHMVPFSPAPSSPLFLAAGNSALNAGMMALAESPVSASLSSLPQFLNDARNNSDSFSPCVSKEGNTDITFLPMADFDKACQNDSTDDATSCIGYDPLDIESPSSTNLMNQDPRIDAACSIMPDLLGDEEMFTDICAYWDDDSRSRILDGDNQTQARGKTGFHAHKKEMNHSSYAETNYSSPSATQTSPFSLKMFLDDSSSSCFPGDAKEETPRNYTASTMGMPLQLKPLTTSPNKLISSTPPKRSGLPPVISPPSPWRGFSSPKMLLSAPVLSPPKHSLHGSFVDRNHKDDSQISLSTGSVLGIHGNGREEDQLLKQHKIHDVTGNGNDDCKVEEEQQFPVHCNDDIRGTDDDDDDPYFPPIEHDGNSHDSYPGASSIAALRECKEELSGLYEEDCHHAVTALLRQQHFQSNDDSAIPTETSSYSSNKGNGVTNAMEETTAPVQPRKDQVERLRTLINRHVQLLAQQSLMTRHAKQKEEEMRRRSASIYLSTQPALSPSFPQKETMSSESALKPLLLRYNSGENNAMDMLGDLVDLCTDAARDRTIQNERMTTRSSFASEFKPENRALVRDLTEATSVFNVPGITSLYNLLSSAALSNSKADNGGDSDNLVATSPAKPGNIGELIGENEGNEIFCRAGVHFDDSFLPGKSDFLRLLSHPGELFGCFSGEENRESSCASDKDGVNNNTIRKTSNASPSFPPFISTQVPPALYNLSQERRSNLLNQLIDRNQFTSAEDNLVLRGINLYGEKQWELISNRFLPDRSATVISHRYSTLCLLIYAANGVIIDDEGNLETPPDHPNGISDFDEVAISKLHPVAAPTLCDVHRWSLNEDITLLKAVPLMGRMYAEVRSRLIPHRDRGHLRKRYQVLERRVKAAVKREKKNIAAREKILKKDKFLMPITRDCQTPKTLSSEGKNQPSDPTILVDKKEVISSETLTTFKSPKRLLPTKRNQALRRKLLMQGGKGQEEKKTRTTRSPSPKRKAGTMQPVLPTKRNRSLKKKPASNTAKRSQKKRPKDNSLPSESIPSNTQVETMSFTQTASKVSKQQTKQSSSSSTPCSVDSEYSFKMLPTALNREWNETLEQMAA
mmetsp:Transcript_66425/g.98456  ORF Transcript_66425/g.98456 Transcript_66425/m.98456 type:complete len:1143 (-) Transcript_66425:222-3650(-)